MKSIADVTAKNSYLRAVIQSACNVTRVEDLKPFLGELSVVKGILLKGTKVVVPEAMRHEMLKRIHRGHIGLNKCKARTRRFIFWPSINADVTSLIKQCGICRHYVYS